eukprot:CAMPEP_0113684012 /NCGR_PEP_ID=MMETSP0038_2-20120614/13710_1 /TAXON_ID=2898 /ORGANISM="Cryptomonas paramecium" /LENGTH=281 /DNA_ID=CAMNT_0000603601 /DNA_START=62 /DNA_END=904 /DNA_ORIENTATION=- /assembly_acc=CAM_ASM_000170
MSAIAELRTLRRTVPDSSPTSTERKAKRRRKLVSEAETIASDMSKLMWRTHFSNNFTIVNSRMLFHENTGLIADRCAWEDHLRPKYCKAAVLRFDAFLPSRGFLARYSVSCTRCYPDNSTQDPDFHVHCSYCNEVLSGSIARPGGKVTDHLITIRHVYNEATAVCCYLHQQSKKTSDLDPSESGFDHNLAQEYVAMLRKWADRIRFPMKSPVSRADFQRLILGIDQPSKGPCAPPTPGPAGGPLSRPPTLENPPDDASTSPGLACPNSTSQGRAPSAPAAA